MSVLDIIIPFSNPLRWNSRVQLFKDALARLLNTPRTRITVVVQKHGEGDIDLSFIDRHHVNVVVVSSETLLWTKENLINIGVTHLPHDWKYVCWLDGDVIFRDHNWAGETIAFLQHHPIVQPWQTCIDLGPNGEVLKIDNSFAYQWVKEPWTCTKMGTMGYKLAHPGYVWACTKWAWGQFGGLLEVCIAGAADHHMALGIIGKADYSIKKGVHPNYSRAVKIWEERASRLGKRLWYVPNTIEHPWHGNKSGKAGRKYVERWGMLTRHNYDPDRDIKYNWQGVIEFSGNKPELQHEMYRYHADRHEDINAVVD